MVFFSIVPAGFKKVVKCLIKPFRCVFPFSDTLLLDFMQQGQIFRIMIDQHIDGLFPRFQALHPLVTVQSGCHGHTAGIHHLEKILKGTVQRKRLTAPGIPIAVDLLQKIADIVFFGHREQADVLMVKKVRFMKGAVSLLFRINAIGKKDLFHPSFYFVFQGGRRPAVGVGADVGNPLKDSALLPDHVPQKRRQFFERKRRGSFRMQPVCQKLLYLRIVGIVISHHLPCAVGQQKTSFFCSRRFLQKSVQQGNGQQQIHQLHIDGLQIGMVPFFFFLLQYSGMRRPPCGHGGHEAVCLFFTQGRQKDKRNHIMLCAADAQHKADSIAVGIHMGVGIQTALSVIAAVTDKSCQPTGRLTGGKAFIRFFRCMGRVPEQQSGDKGGVGRRLPKGAVRNIIAEGSPLLRLIDIVFPDKALTVAGGQKIVAVVSESGPYRHEGKKIIIQVMPQINTVTFLQRHIGVRKNFLTFRQHPVQ